MESSSESAESTRKGVNDGGEKGVAVDLFRAPGGNVEAVDHKKEEEVVVEVEVEVEVEEEEEGERRTNSVKNRVQTLPSRRPLSLSRLAEWQGVQRGPRNAVKAQLESENHLLIPCGRPAGSVLAAIQRFELLRSRGCAEDPAI
ncbi:hypothetical protein E2C01_036567 [Portunus trituberculatus]|uniref:Uncharacterized protein n=1 Tax=Portunus trituberculatus TaxID=210409 RepID=A0A5B7F913_PORTR|nr:hypothetical protein [Portunus trituberculatus]